MCENRLLSNLSILTTIGFYLVGLYFGFKTLFAIFTLWGQPEFISRNNILYIVTLDMFIIASSITVAFACVTALINEGGTFIIMVMSGFILQIIVGMYGLYLSNVPRSSVMNNMQIAIHDYGSINTITDDWDYLQKKHNCCGILNATDWVPITGLPPSSCCDKSKDICLAEAFTKSPCLKVYMEMLKSKQFLATLTLGAAITQILCGCFTLLFRAPSTTITEPDNYYDTDI